MLYSELIFLAQDPDVCLRMKSGARKVNRWSGTVSDIYHRWFVLESPILRSISGSLGRGIGRL